MDAEARRRAIRKHLQQFPLHPHVIVTREEMLAILDEADAVAQAVKEERERCAKKADNWPSECLASGGEECCGPGLAEALRREP